MKILKFNELNENKMWHKTIPQILNWIESKSDMPWLLIDTETTGLGSTTNSGFCHCHEL
jgi:hypothetical protein